MARVDNTVLIDRPPEAVWKFYTELSNIPTLDQYILQARQDSPGPFGEGSTFTLRGADWTLVMRVIEFEPGHKLVYECISPDSLKGSTDSYTFESFEGKTRFSETMDVKSSSFFGLAGSFFGKRAKEDSGLRLSALKRAMESQPLSQGNTTAVP